jgi:hypothetical protein
MKDEDKIFGLIAQAEDIQAHAVKLQQAAQEAVKTLPDATREAVRVQAREIITEASKNASEGLLRASNEAQAVGAIMRRAWLLHGVFLLAVAGVIAGVSTFAVNYLLKSRINELAELKAAIVVEQRILGELQGKTWGLELVTYGDGTRGIVLPRGVKVDRTGAVQDGRTAIVIKP